MILIHSCYLHSVMRRLLWRAFNSAKVVLYIKYTQPDSLGYWWLIIRKLNTSGLHCEPMLCQHLPKLKVLSMDDQLLSRDLTHHINFLVDFKAWPLGYPTIFFFFLIGKTYIYMCILCKYILIFPLYLRLLRFVSKPCTEQQTALRYLEINISLLNLKFLC